MAEGWRSSENAESSHLTKNPWSEDKDKEQEKALVTRTGWGEQVAPLAQNMPPVSNTLDGQDPNANGTNGTKRWRAGFGGVPGGGVAPGTVNFPAENPNPNPNPSPWRAKFPDSTYKGPGNIDASSPDDFKVGYPKQPQAPAGDSPWRAKFPDSTYKGPDTQAPTRQPTPWDPNPGRATFPDSTYKGPDAAPPVAAPQGTMDWKAYAEQQKQLQQQGRQQQPGFQPGPRAGGDAPGVPGNPGLNGVTDEQRKYIDNSLFLKTSMQGYLATGTITGGVMGAAEWALDKKLLATAGQPQTGLMGWWQNHSPILKEQASFAERLAGAEQIHATRIMESAAAGEALTAGAGQLKTLVGGLDAKLASDEALKGISLAKTGGGLLDAAEKQAMIARISALEPAQKLLLKQHEFIGQAANITNPAKVASVIGTQAEVEAGKKLFVTGTAEATQLAEFAKLGILNSKSNTAVKMAEAELERSRAMLQESVEGGAGSLGGRTFNGAVKGLAVAGASLAIGYGIDKLGSKVFGYKAPETDGMGRFLMDGVAVPAILLSNIPSRYKFALAGTAFVGARVADYFAGTGAAVQMSSLLRPNIADGVLITAAALAPVDGKTKAGLVGLAYLGGRAYNGIARLTGLDGGHPIELRDNSINAFTHDQLARTEKSFDGSVERAKLLGKENEAALELQMRDWLSKQATTQPVSHMRGTAALAAGLGQFRLEEGSRFDLTSHADKKDRILKGYNYDFGGEATTWLRMSAGSLVSAQNFVVQNKGKNIDGQAMDDAYMQQLKNAQAKVEKQLDIVYGAHNIREIHKELTKQARVNSGDMQQALVRMKGQFDVLSSNDTRYVAKSARDMALGYLAEASYMKEQGNGEQARTMFLAAVQYLQASQRLDPNAPDNKPIDEISREIANGIPGAQVTIQQTIDKQYQSNWNNPFQLKPPQYPDLQRK